MHNLSIKVSLHAASKACSGFLRLGNGLFTNTRHTYISVVLTLGCNQKWIAEQTGTSIAMIQENYGKYIRDDVTFCYVLTFKVQNRR